MKTYIIKELILCANKLDELKMHKEATILTNFSIKLAQSNYHNEAGEPLGDVGAMMSADENARLDQMHDVGTPGDEDRDNTPDMPILKDTVLSYAWEAGANPGHSGAWDHFTDILSEYISQEMYNNTDPEYGNPGQEIATIVQDMLSNIQPAYDNITQEYKYDETANGSQLGEKFQNIVAEILDQSGF
jgi:hypothetical protein